MADGYPKKQRVFILALTVSSSKCQAFQSLPCTLAPGLDTGTQEAAIALLRGIKTYTHVSRLNQMYSIYTGGH